MQSNENTKIVGIMLSAQSITFKTMAMSWKSQNVNQQQGHWHSNLKLKWCCRLMLICNRIKFVLDISIWCWLHILNRRSLTLISFRHISFTARHINRLSLSLTLSRILVHSFAYSGIKMWIPVCHETFETITYLQRQLFIFQCVILRLISSIRFSVVL